jgi:hypothetical protein
MMMMIIIIIIIIIMIILFIPMCPRYERKHIYRSQINVNAYRLLFLFLFLGMCDISASVKSSS